MHKLSSRHQAFLAMTAAVSLALGAASTAQAQTTPERKTVELVDAKGGAQSVTVVGEITQVDAAQRVVSIKGPRGNIADLRVDPKVKNLDQVKVGDRVRLTYRVGVALALLKGGDEIRQRVESEGSTAAAPGEKPGGMAVSVTTIVANVVSIDRKKNIATLKGPSGNLVDVRVRDPKVLKEVKVGDQVAARVTESLAVEVRPAPAKAAPKK
ncbi:hypothetical protein QTH91_10835 [Variovorax dokdonensis]|uniref:DUF5666 domain-containing protein n=1 Tax=Variovorax dokdonensis TaxID=344883 RepID=A0ABT7NAM1_9BURK|nr:hypothetical protein [Variovorax dokdonensis]MDM0044982.1 hypothetical protein [Variovorax dokdonensis]